jgi:hypothetical protein
LLNFHCWTVQAWPELEICCHADSLKGTRELGLLAWRNRVVWAQQVLLALLARRIGLGARFWSRLIRLQSGNLHWDGLLEVTRLSCSADPSSVGLGAAEGAPCSPGSRTRKWQTEEQEWCVD